MVLGQLMKVFRSNLVKFWMHTGLKQQEKGVGIIVSTIENTDLT